MPSAEGELSAYMILAAEDKGGVCLLVPDKESTPESTIT